MKRRRFFRAYAIAGVVTIGAASASAQSLPPGVDACVAVIERQSSSGADSNQDEVASGPLLGDLCPELAEAINEGAWGDALAGIWADQLSPNAFKELTKLVREYERPAVTGSAPRSEALDESLRALGLEKPTAQLTIWEQIQRWFDERFGSSDKNGRGWLEKWLEHLSPSERVVSYLVVVLGILLVVATVIVVVNELRVSGLLAGEVLRKYAPLAPSAPDAAAAGPRDLDDLARVPLARRPVLLLVLVLERLRARGKARLRDSLTHRELLRAATGLNAEQSARFATVVGAAERVTFGDWLPEESDVDDLVAGGRALLASLPTDEGATR